MHQKGKDQEVDAPKHDGRTNPLRSTSDPNNTNNQWLLPDGDDKDDCIHQLMFEDPVTTFKGACIQGILGGKSTQLLGQVL